MVWKGRKSLHKKKIRSVKEKTQPGGGANLGDFSPKLRKGGRNRSLSANGYGGRGGRGVLGKKKKTFREKKTTSKRSKDISGEEKNKKTTEGGKIYI